MSNLVQLSPRTAGNNLPELPELAWKILKMFQAGTEAMTVKQMNERIAAELDLSESLQQRTDTGGETPFLLRMRYARMALRLVAKAIVPVEQSHPTWEFDTDLYQLTRIGKLLSQNAVHKDVEWFLSEHYLGKRFTPNGKIENISVGTAGSGSGLFAPLLERDWQYDWQSWCVSTFVAIRSLTDGQSGGTTSVGNAEIAQAVSDRLGLSDRQRQVYSVQNPLEQEYKARCATARYILDRVGLIEPIPNVRRSWRLTPGRHALSEQEISELLGQFGERPVPGRGPIPANAYYMGNSELESFQEDLEESPVAPPNDAELCFATLEVLGDANGGLSDEHILSEVTQRLAVDEDYANRESPPWGTNERMKKSLLAYRLEHVFRALSIPSCRAIRLMDEKIAGGGWVATTYGKRLAGAGEPGKSELWSEVAEYFGLHSYEDWNTEPWMRQYIEALLESGDDGTPFEYLCADLLKKTNYISEAVVQGRGYLDQQGSDIVARIRKDPIAQIGTILIYPPVLDSILLVQCKRWVHEHVRADAVSKIFGFWRRLRQSHSEEYNVAGALLIMAGDLERDAEWQFWTFDDENNAVKDRVDGREERDEDLWSDVEFGRDWSVWDGGRLLRLVRTHEVGIKVDEEGNVEVDREYFAALPRDPEKV